MDELLENLIESGTVIFTFSMVQVRFSDRSEESLRKVVKESIARGEIIRLRRETFMLDFSLHQIVLTNGMLASVIDPKSFLSGVGALRFFGLIPEAIRSPIFFGRKNVSVSIYPFNLQIKRVRESLLGFGVLEVETYGGIARVSDPVRSIFDALLSVWQNWRPRNRQEIIDFLRLDVEDEAKSFNWELADEFASFYKSKAADQIASAIKNV